MLLHVKLNLSTVMLFYSSLLYLNLSNSLCNNIKGELIISNFGREFEAFTAWTKHHLLQERNLMLKVHYLILKVDHLIDEFFFAQAGDFFLGHDATKILHNLCGGSVVDTMLITRSSAYFFQIHSGQYKI